MMPNQMKNGKGRGLSPPEGLGGLCRMAGGKTGGAAVRKMRPDELVRLLPGSESDSHDYPKEIP